MRKFLSVAVMLLLATLAHAKQTTPDAKRQREIRNALVSKGYPAGHTWPDTVIILKKIARDHNWQYNHAPDARVLILLGLGNEHSNPAVLDTPPSILEPGLRAEHKSKERATP